MSCRKRFKGLLGGLRGDDVLIDASATHTQPAASIAVPFAMIVDARLVLTKELIDADLKRRKLRDALEKVEP